MDTERRLTRSRAKATNTPLTAPLDKEPRRLARRSIKKSELPKAVLFSDAVDAAPTFATVTDPPAKVDVKTPTSAISTGVQNPALGTPSAGRPMRSPATAARAQKRPDSTPVTKEASPAKSPLDQENTVCTPPGTETIKSSNKSAARLGSKAKAAANQSSEKKSNHSARRSKKESPQLPKAVTPWKSQWSNNSPARLLDPKDGKSCSKPMQQPASALPQPLKPALLPDGKRLPKRIFTQAKWTPAQRLRPSTPVTPLSEETPKQPPSDWQKDCQPPATIVVRRPLSHVAKQRQSLRSMSRPKLRVSTAQLAIIPPAEQQTCTLDTPADSKAAGAASDKQELSGDKEQQAEQSPSIALPVKYPAFLARSHLFGGKLGQTPGQISLKTPPASSKVREPTADRKAALSASKPTPMSSRRRPARLISAFLSMTAFNTAEAKASPLKAPAVPGQGKNATPSKPNLLPKALSMDEASCRSSLGEAGSAENGPLEAVVTDVSPAKSLPQPLASPQPEQIAAMAAPQLSPMDISNCTTFGTPVGDLASDGKISDTKPELEAGADSPGKQCALAAQADAEKPPCSGSLKGSKAGNSPCSVSLKGSKAEGTEKPASETAGVDSTEAKMEMDAAESVSSERGAESVNECSPKKRGRWPAVRKQGPGAQGLEGRAEGASSTTKERKASKSAVVRKAQPAVESSQSRLPSVRLTRKFVAGMKKSPGSGQLKGESGGKASMEAPKRLTKARISYAPMPRQSIHAKPVTTQPDKILSDCQIKTRAAGQVTGPKEESAGRRLNKACQMLKKWKI